jgi:hypothetical protein
MFDEQADVPEMLARYFWRSKHGFAWERLPWRARPRYYSAIKGWLSSTVVKRMTRELLQQRDQHGEIMGWLTTIAEWKVVEGRP